MVEANGLDDWTDARQEALDRICDFLSDHICNFLLDTLKNRFERETELIFPDAEIVAVEMDMTPDTPVMTRITVKGVDHCPRLTASRIDLVERMFGPAINVTVADDIPVSNGFVLVATPRIKSDADEEC